MTPRRRYRGAFRPAVVATAAMLALALGAQGAPAPRKAVLPNGVRMVVQANDHTATVVFSALVRVTALHEMRWGLGTRRMLQGMIAAGTGYGAAMTEAAVRADFSVAPDYVELVLAAPAESCETCAHLLRGLLFDPQLTPTVLEAERRVVLREVVARDELPIARAMERFREGLYPGLGSADSVAADPRCVAGLTLEQLERFHAAHYLPNATVVAVSGGIDGAVTLAALSAALSGVLPGAMPDEAPAPQPEARPAVVELQGNGPTAVYVRGGRGVSLDDALYPATAVGLTALSSGMDARLYRALRIERSLAYTIAGDLTPAATVPSALVLASCDPENVDEVVAVMDAEIARITTEPLSAAELQRAKRYLIGRQALRRQRNQEVAHYLALFELLGGPQGYRRDLLLAGEIATVDAAAVMVAMRRVFEPKWAVRLEGRRPTRAG